MAGSFRSLQMTKSQGHFFSIAASIAATAVYLWTRRSQLPVCQLARTLYDIEHYISPLTRPTLNVCPDLVLVLLLLLLLLLLLPLNAQLKSAIFMSRMTTGPVDNTALSRRHDPPPPPDAGRRRVSFPRELGNQSVHIRCRAWFLS